MGADYKTSYEGQMIGGAVIGQYPANATGFVNVYGGDDLATTTRVLIEVPFDCHIDRLNFRSRLTPGVGETFRCTLFQNGLASALDCTIVDPNTEAEDMVNVIAYARGDTLSVRIISSLNAALDFLRWSMRVRAI